MFSLTVVAATIALSTFSISQAAHIVPRHRILPRLTTPSTYDTAIHEDYFAYHARYLALGCQYNHGNDFFDACCHPLLQNETVCDLEPRCTPDPGVLSSVSSSLEGYTATSSSWSSTADATTTTDAGQATQVAENAVSTWSSSADTWTSDTWTSSSDTWTSSSDTWTSSSNTWTSSSDTWTSTSSASSPSSTANINTGGFGTFFYQKGVAGACGTVHSDYDLVLAMDSAIYSQDLCGKWVTITNTDTGVSVTAVIADECPTCINANSIDMSLGAFLTIGALATGQLNIQWSYA
ncbi:barwin-like endoglucanase [Lentinula aciculospora]|uniref:Barwin-like endoglucanase n=1 Tax=Lentinula aciculospora TaxID=153920 RepID=A0A9W9ADA2_9AGAR|nr:barwin-like endoglucanase [Lentinula aciculospora]